MFSLIVGLVVAVVLLVVNIVLSKIPFVPKELRILTVISIMVGYVYWGFEPFAHHEMHPPVAAAEYKFDGSNDVAALEAQAKEIEAKGGDRSALDAEIAQTKEFWANVVSIAKLDGNVEAGAELVAANCTACHSIESAGFPQLMEDADAAAAYGVTPPDLSLAGRIYDKNYMAAFILNPVKAMHIEHKYPATGTKVFPMPGSDWMSNQEIADMVAYLEDVASQVDAPAVADGASDFEIAKAKNKEVFEAACVRCHAMDYAGIEAKTPVDVMKEYIGATPPDLSQHIRSRGAEYLHNFINDPQRKLPGTGMPRVGLTLEAEKQVVEYMEQIGDSKKQEREALGPIVLIYLTILAVFALLWKKQIWKKLH
ncbi:MAG: c-type cytochrome [Sulfurimonas sp.]|jgi:ubiquinol-cytochrome c reductase cytochrome c1 subunit|nr:c-type cytochrome [Sulfurimonas sp.]